MSLSEEARNIYKTKGGQKMLEEMMAGKPLSPEAQEASRQLKALQIMKNKEGKPKE